LKTDQKKVNVTLGFIVGGNKKEVSHFSVVYEGKIWGFQSLRVSLQPYVSCYCTS